MQQNTHNMQQLKTSKKNNWRVHFFRHSFEVWLRWWATEEGKSFSMSSTHHILFTACRIRTAWYVRLFIRFVYLFIYVFFFLFAIFCFRFLGVRGSLLTIGKSLVNVLIVHSPWLISLLASVFSLLFYRHTGNSCNITTAHISNIRIFILKSVYSIPHSLSLHADLSPPCANVLILSVSPSLLTTIHCDIRATAKLAWEQESICTVNIQSTMEN